MEDCFILQNDRLRITVANCPKAAYNSSRFDWTGFIPEILFDRTYSFGSRESDAPADPMANGAGLCNEFRVPHYASETPFGEKFLKPGVGLLDQKRDGTAWQFDHRYPVTPFQITQTHGKDWIMYQLEGCPWRGIDLREYKTVRLVGNSIVETITLDNCGSAPFHCVEYNHNFLSINHEPISSAYHIELPGYSEDLLRNSITEGNLIVKNGQYTWDGLCIEASRTMTRDGQKRTATYVWAMYHDKLKVGIREYVDIPYEEFCIWAKDSVCTCKVLAPITIGPCSSKTWTRRWECVYI